MYRDLREVNNEPKLLGIMPFRLLPIVKQLYPWINTVKEEYNRHDNSILVKEADSLLVFIDKDFFVKGRSIGTKVEIVNNLHKIYSVIFVNHRADVIIRRHLKFHEKFPYKKMSQVVSFDSIERVLSWINLNEPHLISWEDYINGVDR